MAVVEVVLPRSLRSAVHQERDRILASLLEAGRLQDPGVDAVVARALEPELLGAAHLRRLKPRRVDARQRPRIRAVESAGDDLGGGDERVLRVHQPPARCDRDLRVVVVSDQDAHLAARRVDREDLLARRFLRGDEQALPVGRPGDRLGGAVPGLRQRAALARWQVVRHQPLPIGLEPRPRHRHVGDRPAVGREGRLRVGRLVGAGQTAVARAVRRGEIDIVVGRPGLVLRHFGGERDRLSVRRPGELLLAAEGLRGTVSVRSFHDVDRVPSLHRPDEDVVALSLVPGVPVPDHQPVEDTRLHRVVALLLVPLRRA